MGLSMEFLRQECWSGLPCPLPEDLTNPGIELASVMSPSLAGGFFTTNATWEVCICEHVHAKSCLILCDPMDYSLLGSFVHGFLQARILEWVAVPSLYMWIYIYICIYIHKYLYDSQKQSCQKWDWVMIKSHVKNCRCSYSLLVPSKWNTVLVLLTFAHFHLSQHHPLPMDQKDSLWDSHP